MSSPDENNMSLEEKCELLMEQVVEYRKQYGKFCREYQQKTSVVENKILQLQILKIENTRIKPKLAIHEIDVEKVINDGKKFEQELLEHERRKESLTKDIGNVKQVLMQMKDCPLSKKMSTYQKLFHLGENIENEHNVECNKIKCKKEKKLKDSKIGIIDQRKNAVKDVENELKLKCKTEKRKLKDIKNCIDMEE